MTKDTAKELREWVRSNLTSESESQLDKWKEQVVDLVSLSSSGIVLPKPDPSTLDARSQVLLQLIGRAYAVAGGLVENCSLSSADLTKSVAAPPGTIRRVLSELRAQHFLVSGSQGEYELATSRLGEAINAVTEKVRGGKA